MDRLHAAMDWLSSAQDATGDGGVSAGYHLLRGWLMSYPETTGYIIETMMDFADLSEDDRFRTRALHAAEWLASVQRPNGSITDMDFKGPMVFDTGQALFGFVRAYEETRKAEYLEAARRAGEWLLSQQAADGTWRSHAYRGIPHAYYSRVAWSLLRLHSVTGDERLRSAVCQNVDWVLSHQDPSGWYGQAGFTLEAHSMPFTHTIAYTTRGVLECGLYLEDDRYVESAMTAANGLLNHIPDGGRLAGRFATGWRGDERFSCLTGNAQLAVIFYRLAELTGSAAYGTAANTLLRFLKTRQWVEGAPSTVRGAIAGSSPIGGRYIRYCYPNWATKFLADALMKQIARAGERSYQSGRLATSQDGTASATDSPAS